RLLRARRERPRRRGAAEQADELASPHGLPPKPRTTHYHIVEKGRRRASQQIWQPICSYGSTAPYTIRPRRRRLSAVPDSDRLGAARREPSRGATGGCERSGQTTSLFDHLVGAGEQRRGHLDAERLGSLEVDYELEARRLHDRQVARFLTFEDAPSIPSCFSTDFIAIRAVTHQAAGRDKFAPFVECRNSVTRRKRDESFTDHLEKQRRPVNNGRDIAFWHGRERLLDLVFGADADNQQRLSDGMGCCLHLLNLK